MKLHIKTFVSGPFATNCYLVWDEDTHDAVIIDPAPAIDSQIFPSLTSLHVKAVWITHSHWDHTAGYLAITPTASIPLYVHAYDIENVLHPGSDQIPSFFPIKPVPNAHPLHGKEILSIGPFIFTILHTPGHSPGSVCYYCQAEHVLFTGDTLFKGTYGNTSFPQSAPDLMNESLALLASLPDETCIYPGHGPKSFIKNEKKWIVQISNNAGIS